MKKDIKQMNLMCQSHSGLPSARRKLRHTAITPKPQGKGISAHSLVATTQSRCHLASIDRNAAPRRTLLPRGRSPLPLSPTAALWAKRLRTGRFLLRFNEHVAGSAPRRAHTSAPTSQNRRKPLPPSKKQHPRAARHGPSAVPIRRNQHLEVSSTRRSEFCSAAITKPEFHTPNQPPVPTTSSSLAQDASDCTSPPDYYFKKEVNLRFQTAQSGMHLNSRSIHFCRHVEARRHQRAIS